MSTTAAADSKLASVLSRLTEVTEICDAKGNILGVYTPKEKTYVGTHKHVLIIFDDGATVTFDMERARETLAREKGHGRPLREVIQELEERGRKPA